MKVAQYTQQHETYIYFLVDLVEMCRISYDEEMKNWKIIYIYQQNMETT